jgi:hypothetical protein
MKLSKEVIEERMLCDFKAETEKFYEMAEKKYFERLNQRIEDGDIDKELEAPGVTEKTLAIKEAEKFFKELPQRRLEFVKKYCDDASNTIFDSIKNNRLNESTGKIMFRILKHFILAAEMEMDSQTKMPVNKNKR